MEMIAISTYGRCRWKSFVNDNNLNFYWQLLLLLLEHFDGKMFKVMYSFYSEHLKLTQISPVKIEVHSS